MNPMKMMNLRKTGKVTALAAAFVFIAMAGALVSPAPSALANEPAAAEHASLSIHNLTGSPVQLEIELHCAEGNLSGRHKLEDSRTLEASWHAVSSGSCSSHPKRITVWVAGPAIHGSIEYFSTVEYPGDPGQPFSHPKYSFSKKVEVRDAKPGFAALVLR